MDSFLKPGGAPEAWHILIAVYFSVSIFVVRYFCNKFVFRRLAIWLLSKGRSSPIKFDEATRTKIKKCSESIWKLTYYVTVEAFVLRTCYNEPWFTDTKEYFRGWPNQEIKVPLKLYYMCQCGYYIHSIVAVIAWETRRKDFAVMMTHHVITFIILTSSYITGFFRCGAVSLALHEGSEIIMETAKVCIYSEKELIASVFFGLFAISWLLLRLIYFPFWIINTTSNEIQNHLKLSDPYPTFLYYVFNTLLIMLLVFHVYWWILICSMMMRQFKNKGKVPQDIRSDSDDDDE